MSLLFVFLGDGKVGTIERFDDVNDTHVFTFDQAYLTDSGRPVLGQLFEDFRPRPIQTDGFTPWFEHLLPQGPLRRAVARDAGVDVDDGFALLAWLGDDLFGAVQVRVGLSSTKSGRRPKRKLGEAKTAQLYRAALPGAQWKLSLAEDDKGIVLPLKGQSGQWIGKFESPAFPGIARIELGTMKWALRSGINVPLCRLVDGSGVAGLPEDIPVGSGQVFLIHRFDRNPKGRIHYEDFGQILDRPPGDTQFSGSYEELARVIRELAELDSVEFFRRVIFCVMCGNADAHLKNWSLIYPDGRSARLAPAYDLVATVLYPRIQKRLALSLGASTSFYDISYESFVGLAGALGIGPGETEQAVRDARGMILSAWNEKEVAEVFSRSERTTIDEHIAKLAFA